MRGIDLTCKLMAPILVGMIMSYVSVLAAAIFLCVWNVVSIGFEYYLLRCLYNESAELQQERIMIENSNDIENHVLNTANESSDPAAVKLVSSCVFEDLDNANELVSCFQKAGRTHTMSSSKKLLKRMCRWTSILHQRALQLHLVEGFKVYAAQEMLLAAVALAILHFTVLSFGSLMTAAMSWRGIPSYILGLARGFSALVGICATLSYPKFQGRLETTRTGLWSIVMQWSFLSFCVDSIWISNLEASSALLMGGVVTSRFGLWMFDLAVLQLMQESTPENERGIVGGIQNLVQSLLEMLSFVAGMLISNPKDFDKLVYLSYGAVTMALALYSLQVYRVRGHLLHLDRIFRSQSPAEKARRRAAKKRKKFACISKGLRVQQVYQRRTHPSTVDSASVMSPPVASEPPPSLPVIPPISCMEPGSSDSVGDDSTYESLFPTLVDSCKHLVKEPRRSSRNKKI